MKKNYLGIILAVIVIIIAGYLLFTIKPQQPATTDGGSTTPPAGNAVAYSCADAKTISAVYGDKSVVLTLSDGRTITLPQTMSGSGVQYSTDSGTANNIVFSSKGENAMLAENNATTYSNCIAGAAVTTGYNATFTDQAKTFQFSYPKAFVLSGGDGSYTADWSVINDSQTLGIVLAKITIPSSFEPKTNFAGATVTVGTSPDSAAVKNCLAAPSGAKTDTMTIKGVLYTKMTMGDAGAGNFYNTTSYRTVRNNQCYSIEYTIHSTNIGNYSPDQGITAYDEAKVNAALEQIVQSFTFINK